MSRRRGMVANTTRAFLRSPTGMSAAVVGFALLLVALLAPTLWGDPASRLDVFAAGQGPSTRHVLGTDRLGRDLLARTLVASTLSLSLGLAAAAIAATIGIAIGAFIALSDPRVREVGLRLIDVLLAFPYLLAVIFISAIVGIGTRSSVIAVGIASAPYFARVTATLALSIAGREFVSGARVVGIRSSRLFGRYILPNIAETLAISTFFAIGNAIIAMSSLSFLGIGIQPPEFDWGRMLTEGVKDIYSTPVAALAPAVLIATTGLTAGFLGEAMARALNPLVWTAGIRQRPLKQPIASAAGLGQLGSALALENDRPRVPSDPSSEPILLVEKLTVRIPTGTGFVSPVDGVSFSVASGEMVGVVGESGGGKTMMALAVAHLAPYPAQVSSASLRFAGHEVNGLSDRERQHHLGTRLAMVFQDPLTSLNPALRVGTQLVEGARYHRRLDRRSAEELASQRLRDVQIAAPDVRLKQYPHELSGGMRQRVMMAMGLMTRPELIIADEPTTSLDVTLQAQIIALLRAVNATHGAAILLISHDIALIAQLCTRVLVMYAGRIVEEIETSALLSGGAHPYTRALIGAIPDPAANRDIPLTTIRGRPPELTEMPIGCAFAARCPVRVDRCDAERPELEPLGIGHRVACWVATAGRP